MRMRSDKKPSRKHDRKVLMAEESTKNWADSDSKSSSSSSSSSDSEQEEVHCLMADRWMMTSEGETSTQSQSAYDKFNKMGFVKANMTYDSFESMRYDDQSSFQSSHEGKDGIGYQRPEISKPSWLKNRLDKDKAKAGSKSHVQHQPRRNFRKAKSVWKKTQPRRDPVGGTVDNQLREAFCVESIPVTEYTGRNVHQSQCIPVAYIPVAEMKIEYRLLHDILAKTIFVKAGSFDAVTRDRFLLMTAIMFDVKVNWGSHLFGVLKAMVTPGSRQTKGFAIQIGVLLQNVQGLVLGESKGFPKSRILDAKTVHRFIHINEKVGLDESAASPRVKKTPVNKEVSKKRQAVGVEDAPVVKKKRTTKGKPVVIAQEVVPPKIDATTDAPMEQLSVPKRNSQKRKRKLVLEDAIEVDEPVPAFVEKPVVVPVVEGTIEDPNAVVEQILHQLDTFGAIDGGEHLAPTTKESIPWFDLPVFLARREAEGFVGSSSDTDEELIADQPTVHLVPDAGNQPHVSETVAEGTTDDELLSIEEHQARIPFNASLPSTLAPTITPIRFGQGIEFREVDAYKASLPQIDASDKGKGILVEDDGCVYFCEFFQFGIFSTLQSEDIFSKEGHVLSWAETDSSFVAIQRRRLIIAKYRELLLRKFIEARRKNFVSDLLRHIVSIQRRRLIIAKYRELLLRKFIEARRKNFVSGTPTSAIDLKVSKLLGADHLFSFKDLLRHMREHQLEWTRPSSSCLFEGPVIDRGFFIPPNHHSITSKCWIRAKITVDGSWLIVEGVDYWRPINTPVNSRHWEALPQLPYIDDLAPLCVFVEPVKDIDSRPSLSRAISIVLAEICMEAVQFSLLGSLRPVGSVNFCRDLVVRGSVVEVLETLPIHFRRIIRQGINCNSFVDSVVQLDSAEIREVDVQGIDEVDLVSSEEFTVYRSPSLILQETDSFDCPVHLNGDDIPLEENVNVHTTFPATVADLSPLLHDLKTSLSQRMDNAHSDILSRLNTIERGLQNTPGHQNDFFRNLIQSARQEGQNQDDIQILRLNELKKTIMAQDCCYQERKLEFQAKIAADLLSLSTQIGDLVDNIRGGDAKKGEGSRSRRPLPTPVTQG
ncbi:hypothetical protein F511_24081 [Dorcoceras hygrometricum]|uniref:Uncharacterized protein n=1 Tax=Dorcoceras hygrometricum TaxID=472368 RepID=A0A2Z7B6T2_9LAMI|nr:hypothetical protein F511_24081 [Dorcoceras hygrometricum]